MPESPQTPVKTCKHGEVLTPSRRAICERRNRGWSYRKVAASLGLSVGGVHKLAKSTASGRQRNNRGKKPLLSETDVRRLIRIATKNWESRQFKWAELARQSGLPVSHATVRQALNQRGYRRCKACKKPFIDKVNVKKRIAYAKKHLRKPLEYWKMHICGDCQGHGCEMGEAQGSRRIGQASGWQRNERAIRAERSQGCQRIAP